MFVDKLLRVLKMKQARTSLVYRLRLGDDRLPYYNLFH